MGTTLVYMLASVHGPVGKAKRSRVIRPLPLAGVVLAQTREVEAGADCPIFRKDLGLDQVEAEAMLHKALAAAEHLRALADRLMAPKALHRYILVQAEVAAPGVQTHMVADAILQAAVTTPDRVVE